MFLFFNSACKNPGDVIFVLDSSGSVKQDNFNAVKSVVQVCAYDRILKRYTDRIVMTWRKDMNLLLTNILFFAHATVF